MSVSAPKPTIGYSHFVGIHYAICHGPIDKVTRIRSENRLVWEGEATDGDTISIYEPDLYGPDDAVIGDVDFAFGAPSQTPNAYLVAKQPVSGEDIPAYKGIAAAILNQVNLGFSQYLRPWEFRAQRIHTSTRGAVQWYDEKSEILDSSIISSLYYEGFIGGLDGYTFSPTSSEGTVFAITTDDFGNALIASNSTANTFSMSSGQVIISNYTPTAVEAKLKVTESDFGASYNLNFLDTLNNIIVGFQGRERGDIDALQRPSISHGATSLYLGSSAIDINEWYTFRADQNGTNVDYTVTKISDSSVFASGTISSLDISQIKSYRFFVSDASPVDSSDSVFDDINIYGYLPTGDMNPAHIIRESLTDTNWGLGYTAADIDDTAFTTAADTLFDEEFGISLLWSKEESIEEFIRGVLRHIDGTLYVDPGTGKFVLKLIRDDYTPASLPILDESNIISINDYKKPTIGELTNYVTVQYWDKTTSENAAVSVQDIALAQQQGSVVSANVPFPGVTRGELASRLAARTLAELSNPLITCTIIANREASSLNIGDAFKLSWPKFGLSETIMRVTALSFGELTNGQVKIECVQDVFGLPQAVFSAPTDSSFVNPNNAPANSPYRLAQEANYFTLIQQKGEDFTFDELDGFLMTAAASPTSDALNYRTWTDESGSYTYNFLADFCPTAALTEDFPKATDGTINITVGISGLAADEIADIEIGSPCQINDEIMSVVSVSTTSLTVGRSTIDSPIQDHLTGDRVFFWGFDLYGYSDNLYQDNDTIGVKITPQTGLGQLAIDDAVEEMLTFDQRAYRAWLPGNVKLNTVYFPEYLEGVTGIDSTWAHRDRTLQTGGLNDFTESSIGPEVGTTYTTTLTRVNTSAQLDQNTGITGTSDSLDAGGYDGLVRYSIKSVRDSLDSFYSHEHELPITRTSFIFTEQGDFILTEDGEYLVTES